MIENEEKRRYWRDVVFVTGLLLFFSGLYLIYDRFWFGIRKDAWLETITMREFSLFILWLVGAYVITSFLKNRGKEK